MVGQPKLQKPQRICRLIDLLGLHPQSEAIAIAAREFGVQVAAIHKSYLREARDAITEDVQKTRSQLVKQHHHRLTSLYHVAKTVGEKLAALAQLATLHGLNAPSQVAVTVDVLYNPEEQLRALGDPVMLEKVLALDADFEKVRLTNDNGDGEPEALPDGTGVDAGEAGVSNDPGLQVPATPPASTEGTARFTSAP